MCYNMICWGLLEHCDKQMKLGILLLHVKASANVMASIVMMLTTLLTMTLGYALPLHIPNT